MYIRVKRLKSTAFLHVEPTDTVASIKTKLQDLLQHPPEEQNIYNEEGSLLEDSKSLAELKVETDAALTLALKKADGTWEDPSVVAYEEAGKEDE